MIPKSVQRFSEEIMLQLTPNPENPLVLPFAGRLQRPEIMNESRP